jgi:sugar phosphate isomerase/epimerase
MSQPRIHLAIDNCFASKRWVRPREWMGVIRDLGLRCIEASADTECDPLYGGAEVLADWGREVQAAERETGCKVVNLYSGHGTYATLGLTHHDERVRERMLRQWLLPMVDLAADLGAGLGFFCHAFSDAVLQDPAAYRDTYAELAARLAEVARHAGRRGMAGRVGVEQMYTPHQPPWTVDGSTDLLRRVVAQAGHPFYLTIDVGHQSGQHRFQRPDAQRLAKHLADCRAGAPNQGLWLGPRSAYAAFARQLAADPAGDATAIAAIQASYDAHPHLFAAPQDADPYHWLERLGRWSPIIHLQQTDGRSSGHAPFTAERNRTGIIRPDAVLHALQRGFAQAAGPGLPPPVADIYLTLEVFTSTGELNHDQLQRLAESVRYWRTAVPEDCLPLDQLTARSSP